MNEQDQAVFDEILKRNPEELTGDDKAFLNARRDYLTNDQKRIFASVLVSEDAEVDENGVYVAKKNRVKEA